MGSPICGISARPSAMLQLLLLVSLSAIARAQLDELFLCGFRPSVDCSVGDGCRT